MKADLSRDSFDPNQNFQRVLLQQGRVLLDSDWNEQISILLRQMRVLARSVAGPYAAPPEDPGYEIIGNADDKFNEFEERYNETHSADVSDNLPYDFFVGSGLYCVDGVMIQNRLIERYTKQPFYEPSELTPGAYLVFLDVWERHVIPLEVDGIADAALRGIETAHRSQMVWQARVQPFPDSTTDNPAFTGNRVGGNLRSLVITINNGDTITKTLKLKEPRSPSYNPNSEDIIEFFDVFLSATGLEHDDRGTLVVSVNPPETSNNSAGTTAQSRKSDEPASPPQYRGDGNRLYRVEIQQGGEVKQDGTNVTFKWSRDNGSVVFPVTGVEGNVVTLRAIPGDASRRPVEGSYVDLLDDAYVLTQHITDGLSPTPHPIPRPLFKVKQPTGESYRVTLEHTDKSDSDALPGANHNVLRVWDHEPRDGLSLVKGAIQVPNLKESGPDTLPLEDGLYLRFYEGHYRRGDYWLIPARSGISPQSWDAGSGNSERLAAQTVEHHFAPLAAINVSESGEVNRIQDLRMVIEPTVTVIP